MKNTFVLLTLAGLAVSGCSTVPDSAPRACAGTGSGGLAAGTVASPVSRGAAAAVVVDQAPPLDGTLASPIWQKCPPLVLGRIESHDPGPLQTTVRVLLDKQYLYVGWQCVETNTGALVADATERDGEVWRDDNVELFLSPDGTACYHFAVNAKGVLYDSKGEIGFEGDITWNSAATVKTAIEKNQGWSGTMAIPLKDLAVKRGKGQTWALNFNRTQPTKDSEDNLTFIESSWSAEGHSKYGDASGWGKLTGVNIP